MSCGRILPSTRRVSSRDDIHEVDARLHDGANGRYVELVDDAVDRSLETGTTYRSRADLMFSSRTAKSPFDWPVIIGLRSEPGAGCRNARAHLGELAARFARLALEPYHLDFRDDFLAVKLARDIDLPVEQLHVFGEPRLLLSEDIDVLRQLSRMRFENAFSLSMALVAVL